MIPLVKKLDIDEINTSLIAIRKLLNNVGITETNITNIVGKDYDDKIQELEEKIEAYSIYSTTEHWTGKYWIDGKKIYRKVYTFTSPLSNIDATSLNIDFVIKIEGGGYAVGSGQSGNQWLPLGFTASSGDIWVSLDYNKSSKKFSYTGWRHIENGYYIFEYTKTTD